MGHPSSTAAAGQQVTPLPPPPPPPRPRASCTCATASVPTLASTRARVSGSLSACHCGDALLRARRSQAVPARLMLECSDAPMSAFAFPAAGAADNCAPDSAGQQCWTR